MARRCQTLVHGSQIRIPHDIVCLGNSRSVPAADRTIPSKDCLLATPQQGLFGRTITTAMRSRVFLIFTKRVHSGSCFLQRAAAESSGVDTNALQREKARAEELQRELQECRTSYSQALDALNSERAAKASLADQLQSAQVRLVISLFCTSSVS